MMMYGICSSAVKQQAVNLWLLPLISDFFHPNCQLFAFVTLWWSDSIIFYYLREKKYLFEAHLWGWKWNGIERIFAADSNEEELSWVDEGFRLFNKMKNFRIRWSFFTIKYFFVRIWEYESHCGLFSSKNSLTSPLRIWNKQKSCLHFLINRHRVHRMKNS